MMQSATKRWFLLTTLFFFMTAAAFAGVSVSSPSPGSTDGSPVHFVASASGSSPISAMRIYVDSNSAYLASTSSLNTNISMGNGSHSISVQAWDTQGHVYINNFSINVGGSGSSSPPPSGPGTTFGTVEQMSGWQSCTTCAGAGGNGPSAVFWTKQFVGSPSQNGKSMQFFLGGSHPYSDALWWKQLGANNGATHFQYDVDFYLTSPQSAQALEFDINQSNGSRKFIFGTECNIKGGGVWDVWDAPHGRWQHTGVACSMPSAFTWHHLTWEVYRDSSSTHFVAVTLDGVKHFINASYGTLASGAHEVNVAFQMDGDFAQHNYSTWLNFVTLRYW